MEVELLNVEVSLVAVLLVAILHMVLGMAWYGVFAKQWLALNKLTEAEARKNPTPAYVGSLASVVCYGFVLGILVGYVRLVNPDFSDLTAGLVTGVLGAILGLGQFVSNHMFSMRPLQLMWIDGGFAALNFIIAGLVVAFV